MIERMSMQDELLALVKEAYEDGFSAGYRGGQIDAREDSRQENEALEETWDKWSDSYALTQIRRILCVE